MDTSDFDGAAPPESPAGAATRQAQKSSEMRSAILETATAYIARHGYSRTTLAVIASKAGISRGAITHHYASKVELAAAVLDHIFQKRMKLFLKRTKSLTEKQRVEENLGVEVAWEIYDSREYKAYLQINAATLTDPDLYKMFVPKVQQHESIWWEASRGVFAEWEKNEPLLSVTGDLLKAVLDGMLFNRHIWHDPEREAKLRALVATIIIQLRDGKLSAPTADEVKRFFPPRQRKRPAMSTKKRDDGGPT